MNAFTLRRDAYLTVGTFGMLSSPKLDVHYPTVEQPWRNNKPNESCIPLGLYQLELYDSPSFHRTVLLLHNDALLSQGAANGTPRSYIEIHPANWVYEVRGCIAPGVRFNDTWGVSHSRDAVNSIVGVFEEGDELLIVNAHPGGIPK